METKKNAVSTALSVIVLDPKISAWLAKNDPKALDQAKRALEAEAALPKKWVVTTVMTPTNYNRPESRIVEAATDKDARDLVKHHLRDLATFSSGSPNEKYDYKVTPYVEPPKGRVLGGAL